MKIFSISVLLQIIAYVKRLIVNFPPRRSLRSRQDALYRTNLQRYAKREGRSLRRQPSLELAALYLSNIGIIAYIVSG
jgi:hypothetical protein